MSKEKKLKFKKGDIIKINYGAFKGFYGRVKNPYWNRGNENKGNVLFETYMYGKKIQIAYDSSSLSKTRAKRCGKCDKELIFKNLKEICSYSGFAYCGECQEKFIKRLKRIT